MTPLCCNNGDSDSGLNAALKKRPPRPPDSGSLGKRINPIMPPALKRKVASFYCMYHFLVVYVKVLYVLVWYWSRSLVPYSMDTCNRMYEKYDRTSYRYRYDSVDTM